MKKSLLKKGIIFVVLGLLIGTGLGSSITGFTPDYKIMGNNPPNPPTLILLDPPIGPSGNYHFVVTGFDPDRDKIKYEVYWDDGWPNAITDLVNSGVGVQITHRYEHTGIYIVKAKSVDEHGAASGWGDPIELEIIVNYPPNPPRQPSGPITGYIGKTYRYTTSTSDFNDHAVQYMWDADGDDEIDEETDWYLSGEECTIELQWNIPGTYGIKVKAKDIFNDISDWSPTLNVTIKSHAPTKPILTGQTSGESGTEYIYTAMSTDEDKDKISYCFNWGDGTSDFCTTLLFSGEIATGGHTWSTDGDYTITVIASDEHGVESEPATLKVSMPKNKVLDSYPLLQCFLELIKDRFPRLIPS